MHETFPQPRWLEQLREVLLRVKMPVGDVVLADETLSIAFDFGTGRVLTTELRQRSEARQNFATTRRFALSFRGSGSLSQAERKGLDMFVRVLREIETRLPAELDGVGAVFVTPASSEERFLALFPFCTVERSHAGDEQITEVLVRTTPRCNQNCPYCTAPEHATPSAAVIRALLSALPSVYPNAMVSLTGGEPTLRGSFLDEVVQATSIPEVRSVQVQTNAVSFASKLDPTSLTPNPKLSFFVSLHALDETSYDTCTGTQGQLQLALQGLQRLINGGHRVTINCVVNAANFDGLEDYVRQLPRTLALGQHTDLHFSTLICPESRPGAADFLVPYPAVARKLRSIVSLATDAGMAVQSLRASTHAAMPPCMLDPEERNRDPHRPEVLAHESGRLETGRPWVKAAGCNRCEQQRHCLGVPRAYALRFGLDDLKPLRAK